MNICSTVQVNGPTAVVLPSPSPLLLPVNSDLFVSVQAAYEAMFTAVVAAMTSNDVALVVDLVAASVAGPQQHFNTFDIIMDRLSRSVTDCLKQSKGLNKAVLRQSIARHSRFFAIHLSPGHTHTLTLFFSR